VISDIVPVRNPEISQPICITVSRLKWPSKIAKYDCQTHHAHPSLCLSLLNEQLISERLWIFRKSHSKINISLESDKKASVYTRPLCICGTNWLNISYSEKIFETRFHKKLKHIFHSKVTSEKVLHCRSLKN
jgi:hypothetical protein